MRRRLEVEVVRDRNRLQICSPGIGSVCDVPHDGDWLAAGAEVGCLRQLNRIVDLHLPKDVSGVVRNRTSRDRVFSAEYRSVLFELEPLSSTDAAGKRPNRAEQRASESGPGLELKSPTDGVFYRRSTPDSAPFVEVGQSVRLGQTIGLVEVMKTFNQIPFEGRGFPETAEVAEILVEDGQEIASGQTLMRLR